MRRGGVPDGAVSAEFDSRSDERLLKQKHGEGHGEKDGPVHGPNQVWLFGGLRSDV